MADKSTHGQKQNRSPREAADSTQHQPRLKPVEVFEEGQPEQGARRVPREDLEGTPLGSDPRE